MTDQSIIPDIDTKFRSILIFGPPGAGKGTIGRFLSGAGSHYHLSSGDIYRGLSPESPAGKLFFSYGHKGLLLPDDVAVELWRNYVAGLIATNCYFPEKQYLLLDGVPRTLAQAQMLDQYVEVDQVIVLEVDDRDELIRRMQNRAKIEKRHDDMDTEVLKTRFEVYQKDTAKVLSHYSPEIISRFNGDQPPLAVLRDVLIELSDILTFRPKVES